jgi:hypothetical protein
MRTSVLAVSGNHWSQQMAQPIFPFDKRENRKRKRESKKPHVTRY